MGKKESGRTLFLIAGRQVSLFSWLTAIFKYIQKNIMIR